MLTSVLDEAIAKRGASREAKLKFETKLQNIADELIACEEITGLVKNALQLYSYAPHLFGRVIALSSGVYGNVNCHTSSLYLMGAIPEPVRVHPWPTKGELYMGDILERLMPLEKIEYGCLVTKRGRVGIIPHSGIAITSAGRESLILSKLGTEKIFDVQPLREAFRPAVEYYSLKI
ncbi:MAG: hypothetical protein HGA85_06600 [Nanoarchaeota archaeon]|nr:hypothetical protein [Nanoarchaeota archaeon]